MPDYPNNNELTQAVSIVRKYVLTRWQHCLPRETLICGASSQVIGDSIIEGLDYWLLEPAGRDPLVIFKIESYGK